MIIAGTDVCEVCQVDLLEDCQHGFMVEVLAATRVRVCELVDQRSDHIVRLLWDVEDLLCGAGGQPARPLDDAVALPQPGQAAEDRGLA